MRDGKLERKLVGLVVLLFAMPSFSLRGEEGWQAGVAKVRITPALPMPMAGYAARGAERATGTLNDLWAKSLLIQDANGRRGLLITMDLCGIDRHLSSEICQRLAERMGLRENEIILSVSHTHSGPVVAKYLEPMHYLQLDEADRRLVDDYARFLVERVVDCAVQARAELKPSRLSHASGQVTFATNRRNNPAEEVLVRRAAGKLVGPVDYSLPVLAVHQGESLIATVFGYACHCTTLSGQLWSSDYAGFALDRIEAERPGCIALFWAGCGADQNPLPRRTVDLAVHYGRQLASGVQSVLDGVLQPIDASLTTQRQEVELPFDALPTESQLTTDSESRNTYIAARAKMLLEKLESGESLSPSYPYPIATWRLGESVDWVALGGEVVVDYALAIKSSRDGSRPTWVMAYANDVMAYIPSRRVLAEGGYEGGGSMVYYGLPASWAPVIEKTILDEVDRQLDQPVSQSAAFPAGVMPQLLQETGAGEGPLWHRELGLFTSGDGHIMLRSKTGQQSIYFENAGSNGLALDSQGGLLICQNVARQVSRRDAEGNLTVLTSSYEGMKYNQPNDITLDSQGRIYFSDPKYGPRGGMEMIDNEGKKVEGVYRIDLNGHVTRIIAHEVDRPNGLVISDDDRFLFVADNNNDTVGGARKLWRFNLTAAGGIEAGSRKLLYDWGQTRGPDGMELDQLGRLYVAAGANNQNPPFETQAHPTAGVYVFTSEGDLLEFVPIPRDECTNVAFGGEEGKTLFVTAGGSLWSIPTLVAGR